jgi:hypothetical protein
MTDNPAQTHAARTHDNAAQTHDAQAQEDTVEFGLADDLLGPAEEADPDPDTDSDTDTDAGTDSTINSAASTPATPASTWSDQPDEEDYLAPVARRGKLTTALIVALIFIVGILVGTVLYKALAPAPPPQIVYVLNDAGSSAPSAPIAPAPTTASSSTR